MHIKTDNMICIKKGENKMDYKKDDCSKTISFGRITGSSTDVETVIFDYDRYELGNSKRCFSSVKKLIINENVEWIKVPNSMFPNVRTIISKSTQFRSGNVLIHESFWSRPTLLNVFGVEPDETIDLIGVQVIDSLALRGCKTIHFINTESVRFIEANSVRLSIFEDSEIERMILEKRYHEGVIMAGTILLAVNPDADEIEVPRNTTYIFPTVDFTKNKRVIIHDFRLVQTFKFEFQTLVIFDDDKSGNFSRDEMYDIIAKNIEVLPGSKLYCTVDGILYSKDMHTLIRCPLLKTGHVDIPDGVSEIGKYAFRLGRINSVSLPDSLVKIERMAFFNSKISDISFGKGIKKIGESYSFSICANLTRLILPPQAEEIGDSVFSDCKNLSEVIFNSRLVLISRRAFSGCDSLEKVVIPESVQKIEKSALNKVQHVVFHGNPASHVAIAFIREKPATEYMPDTASYTIRIDLPGNKTAYMPRYVKFDDIYTISDIISKPNLAIADILTLHAYASSTISKQEAAILTYSAYKDKAMDESGLIEKQKLYTYCKRSAKSYVESILDQNKDKNIVQVLNAGLLSNKALKDLMDEVDENSILRPYMLEAMQKTKHVQQKRFNV